MLGKTINEMVGAAYPDRLGEDARPPATTALHPLGYEVGRILASDSPISVEDREALHAVLNRMLEPYRRDMRRRRDRAAARGPVRTPRRHRRLAPKAVPSRPTGEGRIAH